MKQQTAVEWLMNKSLKNTYILNTEYVKDKRIIIELDEFINLFEQANKMFQKQILDAICSNQNGMLRRKTVLEAKKYYNETFNAGTGETER